MANLTDDQRSKMTLSISSKKGTLKELKEEMEALLNFDHRASLKRDEKKEHGSRGGTGKTELRMDELNGEMFEALEKVDESLIEKLIWNLIPSRKKNANFLNLMGILFWGSRK